jgi:DNA-binding PadR family transcriptional regulator
MAHVRKMLRKLAEKGYLICERDGSMKRIRLTEKGWKFVMNGKKGTSADTILYPMALKVLKQKQCKHDDGRTKHSI